MHNAVEVRSGRLFGPCSVSSSRSPSCPVTRTRADHPFLAAACRPRVETVATDGIASHTTYRLVVDLVNSARSLYTVFGTEAAPLSIPAAWQHAESSGFGSNVGGKSSYVN